MAALEKALEKEAQNSIATVIKLAISQWQRQEADINTIDDNEKDNLKSFR
jgi:bilin biosynthesis protein